MPDGEAKAMREKKWGWPIPLSYVAFIHTYLAAMYYGLTFWWAHTRHDMFNNKTGMYYTDFVNIWSAARLALQGRIMEMFDGARLLQFQQILFGPQFNYRVEWYYPLHFMPWVVGLGALSYPSALVLWLALTFGFYAFAVAFKRPQPWILALVLLFAPASFTNITFGQNGFLTAALFAGGIRVLDKKPALSGVLFGFLTFKPQLCLLVPLALLAGRRRKTLAAMAITIMALVALSVALFGLEPWQAYIDTTLSWQHRLLVKPAIAPAFAMTLAPTPFMAARLIGAPLIVAGGIAVVFGLYAAAAVVCAFVRPASLERRGAILMTAAFLATPYAMVYDLTSLSAAVIFLLAAESKHSMSWDKMVLLLVAWVLPLITAYVNAINIPVSPAILIIFLAMQLRWMAKEGAVTDTAPAPIAIR